MRETTITVEKKGFIAEDGTVFEKYLDCFKHENKILFESLIKTYRNCMKRVYDDNIKELVELYLDKKDINKLASCTELYIAQVGGLSDIQQVIAFCKSKDPICDFDDFETGQSYLICVHSILTMMDEDNQVYIIPFSSFRDFWLNVFNKLENIRNYVSDEEYLSFKSPYEMINDYINNRIEK